MPGVNYNAPQYGVKFELNRAGFARCVFNDPNDPDNIGSITAIDGLDGPEVREQGENLQEADGGVHATFFYGRRSVTIEGVIHGHASVAQRNDNIQKLMNASNAMRDDVQVTWQPSGGQQVYALMRRQQPLRIEGLGFNKTFTVTLVAADPRIYSTTLESLAIPPVGVTAANNGSTVAYPSYVLTGNAAAAASLTVNGAYVASFTSGLAAEYIYFIDSLKRTVQKAARSGFIRNSFPNPSFEKPSGSLYAVAAPHTTALNAFATMPTPSSGWGTHVAQFDSDGTSNDIAGVELVNPNGSGYWTLPYLQAYTVGFSILAGAGSPNTSVMVRTVYYNAANGIVSTDNQVGGTALSGTWFRVISPNTNLSSGSVKARIYIGLYNDNAATVGNHYYLDGVHLDLAHAAGGAFNEPTVATGWVWEGAANDSSSIFVPSGTPTSTGALSGAYDTLDLTRTDWVGLPPGSNVVALSNQGIGATIAMSYRHAWM